MLAPDLINATQNIQNAPPNLVEFANQGKVYNHLY